MNEKYEYWTKDKRGRGFCSTESIENALAGHFHDMNASFNPLGPIVEVYVIKTVIKTETKRTSVSLKDQDIYFGTFQLKEALE